MIISIQVVAYSNPLIDPPVAFKRDTKASDDSRYQPRQKAVDGVEYPGLAITYESVEQISLGSSLEQMARTIDPSADVTIFGDGDYWKRFEIKVSEEVYNNADLQKQLLEQTHEMLAPYVTPYP